MITLIQWKNGLYNLTPSSKATNITECKKTIFNHNGVNSLNFSPETGKLVLQMEMADQVMIHLI